MDRSPPPPASPSPASDGLDASAEPAVADPPPVADALDHSGELDDADEVGEIEDAVEQERLGDHRPFHELWPHPHGAEPADELRPFVQLVEIPGTFVDDRHPHVGEGERPFHLLALLGDYGRLPQALTDAAGGHHRSRGETFRDVETAVPLQLLDRPPVVLGLLPLVRIRPDLPREPAVWVR